MANETTFDGGTVDLDDPKQVLSALRKIEFKLLSGEGEVKLRFGDSETTFQEASLPRLQIRIGQLEKQLDRVAGKRTRFAASVTGI